jgi:hypothetical protein
MSATFYTLFLDMSCWWVVQFGYWGDQPRQFGFFRAYQEASHAADGMNRLVPTVLEKSLCRSVSSSRPG